jgi:hypothetical protein
MTAATVELYVRGDNEFIPILFHFSHEEVMTGVIDEVIADMSGNPDSLMLCIRWHDHDFCEEPTQCRGNEPSGDDFHFFTKENK